MNMLMMLMILSLFQCKVQASEERFRHQRHVSRRSQSLSGPPKPLFFHQQLVRVTRRKVRNSPSRRAKDVSGLLTEHYAHMDTSLEGPEYSFGTHFPSREATGARNNTTPFVFTRRNITVETLNHERSSARRPISLEGPGQKLDILRDLNNTSSRIFAAVGEDALLPCRVGHLGERQVSWIRRRDWFVLTSGDAMYAHNDRFAVLHEVGSQDWTLRIKRVTDADSGLYECQVSTGTGIISFHVELEVMTPTAHIPRSERSHVYRGSPFIIYCYVLKTSSPIQHVPWSHNGEPLNYKREQNDYVITTKIQRRLPGRSGRFDYGGELLADAESNVVLSRLKVRVAKETHSGNYTCGAPPIRPDSTQIFVNEGDKTAAVQGLDIGGICRPTFVILTISCIFVPLISVLR